MDVHALTLSDVTRRVKSGELTARGVAEAMLARIERLEPALGAYVTVLAERALAQADALDARRERGETLGLLHGAPIALKDLLYTKGIPTSCGTTILADWRPDEDATIVTRLEAAGAIMLGKVKLTEGAFGEHHPAVDPPKSPWNKDRWTGVSSSGSGVAVAAGLAHGAIGTDTGGSIRFPSAACGLVGIKPTYGRVSRHGAFPLSETLDHVGPMTRSVEDAARMLLVMAGRDPKDPTSLDAPVPSYASSFREDLAGVKIGIDWDFVGEGVHESVVGTVRDALDLFAVSAQRSSRSRCQTRGRWSLAGIRPAASTASARMPPPTRRARVNTVRRWRPCSKRACVRRRTSMRGSSGCGRGSGRRSRTCWRRSTPSSRPA